MRCQACHAIVQCALCGVTVAENSLRVRRKRKAEGRCYDCGKPFEGQGKYSRCARCRVKVKGLNDARKAKAAAAKVTA